MPAQVTRATQPHSGEPADVAVDRDQDQLLLLPEVADLMRATEASLRWLRHQGQTPYLFKSGRRLVAWKSDVLAHLEAERRADQARRASA